MIESGETTDLSMIDPGARWRQIARHGAVLSIASTLIPLEHGDNLWKVSDQILDIARGDRSDRGLVGILVTVFCLMMVPVLISGAAVAIAASIRSLIPGDRRVPIGAMMILFFGTALVPAYFFGFHMRDVVRDDTAAIVGIGTLILFLFIGGLTFLIHWDQRKTPLAVFGLGILPIALNMLAWIALGLVFVLDGPAGWLSYVFIFAGVVGAAMMLFGWLRWWGSVKRHLRAPPQR
jgi:hypothetical protein